MIYVQEPNGVSVTQVDNVLSAGDDEFNKKVINRMKNSFKFGSEEELEFCYLGINIWQSKDGIVIEN